MITTTNDKVTSTIDLFWKDEHLHEFRKAWDNLSDYEEANNWIIKIWQQGVSFKNANTELAVEKDVQRLLDAARSGCNLMLHRAYYKIWWKWATKDTKEAEKAADYISNAWDYISTAQCTLARRWYVYIDWYFEDFEELS